MCVRYDLERSAPLSSQHRVRRNMDPNPVHLALWAFGNVQSRPTKGDSSLGIIFENPLKLHTHSLAYTLYV